MSPSRRCFVIPLSLSCCLLALGACTPSGEITTIDSGRLEVEFNSLLHSRVRAKFPEASVVEARFSPSEYAVIDGKGITDFPLSRSTSEGLVGLLGEGTRFTLIGESKGRIEKQVRITAYKDFPDMLTFQVTYRNNSPTPKTLSRWVNNAHSIRAGEGDPAFWSYQGASYEDRRDWVMPLKPGFSQDNYFGMNADDYGGGTPVSDVWRRDIGLAVGHLETVPKLVSIPVRYPEAAPGAEVSVEYEYDFPLAPGASVSTLETFLFVHEGDYYAALKNYRKVMSRQGLTIAKVPDAAYEPAWCSWGYQRNFSVDEVRRTLPKAKKVGLEWAVLDDGWQTSEGDWYLDPKKFPKGTPDMQALVKDIKAAGLKAKLWWAPLAGDPGTDLLKEHEDMLLLDEGGKPQKISWWDSYYLCPAYDKTVEYSKGLVRKFLGEYGFQGLKIDGQHLNGVPRCYNPKHHHQRPEESVEKLQDFWREMYRTAQSIDKEAVVEICPCGTSYAFFNLPYMNQSVASDPLSSWQVRLKGKTLKALAGESAAYSGDHVELSDQQSDFASSLGIGAVVETKFTLPSDDPEVQKLALTSAKEAVWSKWIHLYKEKMLPKGEYLGELYDLGFDRPEAHAIRKDGVMYYAFYAADYRGPVELRGLDARSYQITDYVNNRKLEVVNGPVAALDADFHGYLLVEARPVEAN